MKYRHNITSHNSYWFFLKYTLESFTNKYSLLQNKNYLAHTEPDPFHKILQLTSIELVNIFSAEYNFDTDKAKRIFALLSMR